MFNLAFIAKENIDNDNLLNPLNFLKLETLQLLNDSKTAKAERISRNLQEKRRFKESEKIRIKIETKTFNRMRMEEADKKIRSLLYLSLWSEGKRMFVQKFTKVKILWTKFANFWKFFLIKI